jgi:Amt family ammonium transporter
MWGTISLGLFGLPAMGASGLFTGGGFQPLLIQILGTVVVSALAFSANYVLWTILKASIGIRVSAEEEVKGLDIAEHGAEGYVSSDSLRDPVILKAARAGD